jgi:hypothetical protein
MLMLSFSLLKRGPSVVDYYKILGVGHSATATEIKSAYRRLARVRHPDVNRESQSAAREFALIATAYKVLSDTRRRQQYDARLARYENRGAFTAAPNPYLARMRTVAAQARMDRAIDNLFAADRQANVAFQRAVYPTVALFLSTFLAALLRPYFWQGLGWTGKSIILGLFLTGLCHLIQRFEICIKYYAKDAAAPVGSNDTAETRKGITWPRALSFLSLGIGVFFGLGLFIGEHTQYDILKRFPFFFDSHIHPELLLYPPIAVLIVDTLHTLAVKVDF